MKTHFRTFSAGAGRYPRRASAIAGSRGRLFPSVDRAGNLAHTYAGTIFSQNSLIAAGTRANIARTWRATLAVARTGTWSEISELKTYLAP